VREVLSKLITDAAIENERFVALSGDHGYALFDAIRSARPAQFLNVGVMEQAMVGIAAGLARLGFRPLVYGLAAFIPIRVLEQIKLDVCYSKLPVIFLGDGAGLVYSTLGASHQSAEDLACLRPLPYLRIYSPCDQEELRACYREALQYTGGPSYIRIGKSDRPVVHERELDGTGPQLIARGAATTGLVATGAMSSIARTLAVRHGLSAVSMPRIKPMAPEALDLLQGFEKVIVLEEHSRYGGLASAITDAFVEQQRRPPLMQVFSLQEKFMDKCGSHQYALDEHGMSDAALTRTFEELFR
jgi:transketolase